MIARRTFLAGLTGLFAAPAVASATIVPAAPQIAVAEPFMQIPTDLIVPFFFAEIYGIDGNGNAARPRHEPNAADLAPKYRRRGFA